MSNYFEKLNSINVNGKTEKKNGLTYLSWAYAWENLKKQFPLSYYTIYENADGWNYHTDGSTAWVKTGVTVVDGDMEIEHIEFLPIMDNRNKSIAVGSITSMDVNKAIQRSLTKACGRHGIGLYVYAGEDLPTDETESIKQKNEELAKKSKEELIDMARVIITEKKFKEADICKKLGIGKLEDLEESRLRDASYGLKGSRYGLQKDSTL